MWQLSHFPSVLGFFLCHCFYPSSFFCAAFTFSEKVQNKVPVSTGLSHLYMFWNGIHLDAPAVSPKRPHPVLSPPRSQKRGSKLHADMPSMQEGLFARHSPRRGFLYPFVKKVLWSAKCVRWQNFIGKDLIITAGGWIHGLFILCERFHKQNGLNFIMWPGKKKKKAHETMPGRNALSRKILFLVGGLKVSACLKGSVLVGCLMPGNSAVPLGSWGSVKVQFPAVNKQGGSWQLCREDKYSAFDLTIDL